MTQVSSLYLHVPFCRHLCNYCDFYKRSFDRPKQQIEEFHRFLSASMARHKILLNDQQVEWLPLKTIYLGGGTPSLWGESGAKFMQETILQDQMWTGAEFTMEVDPGTWTPQML